MEKRKETHFETSGHFSESELAEIMSFIETNEETIADIKIDTDKVASAWSQVNRKRLFGPQ